MITTYYIILKMVSYNIILKMVTLSFSKCCKLQVGINLGTDGQHHKLCQ